MSAPATRPPPKSITLVANAEVPDEKGRVRFTLARSAAIVSPLRRWTKSDRDHLPYRAAEDGTAVFWATPLGKKTEGVLRREVERLRGQKVEVTVAPKRYAFYPEGSDEVTHGVALTLATILEAPAADKSQ
jgi:hypothetical protein